MMLKTVTEGRTRLEIPDPDSFRTAAGDYAPSLAEVFYNPRMELSRDLSVVAAQVSARRLGKLWSCDPLAGVGARGIRYTREVTGISRNVLNDHSTKAHNLLITNSKLNNVEKMVEIHNREANALLWENRGRFNFIDLDPFGSPAPFLEAACAAMARTGVLAITATDTAPLCGTHAQACVRRYGSLPLRTGYCRELGVRILVGFVQRVGGKHELTMTPLFSHATEHHFRVYLWAERGARKADQTFKNLGHVSHCLACGRREVTPGLAPILRRKCDCGEEFSHAGPLWVGPLGDAGFLREAAAELPRRGFRLGYRGASLLARCIDEVGGPPTFYGLNELAGIFKVPAPRLEPLLNGLRAKGFFASRTHFSDTGFRTAAPFDLLAKIFKG